MMFLKEINIVFSTSNFVLLKFFEIRVLRLISMLYIPSKIRGPFCYPVKTKKFVTLRSIHIYKESGVSFALRVHRMGLGFYSISNYKKVIYFIYFISYLSPLGINFKIKYILQNARYSNVKSKMLLAREKIAIKTKVVESVYPIKA